MLTWEEITGKQKVDMGKEAREKDKSRQRAYEEYKAARPQAREESMLYLTLFCLN